MMRAAVPILSLMLAACSQQAPVPPENPGAAAAPAPIAAQVAATDEAPMQPAATLVLHAEGIALGEADLIAFGSPAAAVVAKVGAAFGQPPDNVQTLDECGAGALDIAGWDNGFTAYNQDGAFVGWTAIDQRTAEGIGFGSTRAELEAAYQPQIEETSLGLEFSAGGLSGVLESDAPDAAITDIWAGVTCVMR